MATIVLWHSILWAGRTDIIQPGRGIGQEFHIGENVTEAIRRFEMIQNRPSGAIAEGGSYSLRLIGIRLIHDNHRIRQIIIYNSNFSTDRYVRVFSPVDAVYSAYGRPTASAPIRGGYYLRYDSEGIGFDIDGMTHLIRAIVIYPSRMR